MSGKELRVSIPEGWKITFGPLVPGMGQSGTLAFRVYETKEKQRLLLTDVTSFRDETVLIESREQDGWADVDAGYQPPKNYDLAVYEEDVTGAQTGEYQHMQVTTGTTSFSVQAKDPPF